MFSLSYEWRIFSVRGEDYESEPQDLQYGPMNNGELDARFRLTWGRAAISWHKVKHSAQHFITGCPHERDYKPYANG